MGGLMLAALVTGACAEDRTVSFARIGASIPAGTPWAKLQYQDPPLPCATTDVLAWDSKSNEIIRDRDFERVFREEMAKAGVPVSGDPTNLFETDEKSADLQIGGLVKRIDASFCSRQNVLGAMFESRRRVSGSVEIDVEWQVYSTLEGRVIARIPTSGRQTVKTPIDGSVVTILVGGFADAARSLAQSAEFRKVLAQPASPEAPTPLALKLAAPTTLTPDQARAAVATVFAGESMGSAFLISPEGLLLTNRHVVGDARRVRVRWSDGTETVGEVLRSNRRRDVALVKVEAGRRGALTLRRSAPPAGAVVFAIGTPLDQTFQSTLTRGVVSGHRVIEGQPFLQSDVVVNRGNSGGPLIDENGAVVGVTVSGIDVGGAPAGINLFIPIDDALKALALTPAS